MGIIFNAREIFEIAVQIEKNGSDFYARAGDRSLDPALHDCFKRLAAMELEHVETFTRLSRDLLNNIEAGYDPEDEAVLYLKAFARGHVFDTSVDVEALFADLRTPTDILKKAIVAEKDSIAFYTGIKAFVPDSDGKKKIDAVIAQEMSHIAELSDLLEKQTSGSEQ